MKKVWVIVLIALLLCSTVLFGLSLRKPDISKASYFDLVQVHEIGDVRATRILDYFRINPEATIDELVLVEGIGDKTVELLKRRFR